jgi:hypothetical protein
VGKEVSKETSKVVSREANNSVSDFGVVSRWTHRQVSGQDEAVAVSRLIADEPNVLILAIQGWSKIIINSHEKLNPSPVTSSPKQCLVAKNHRLASQSMFAC